MILWEKAAPLILPDLVDCPWDLARDRLINAAREFFTRSLAWRHDLDPFRLQANMHTYDAVDFRGAEVVQVAECWLDGDELEPLTADELIAERARQQSPGRPEYMSNEGDNLVVLPTPTESGAVCRVSVALKPAFNARGLEDILWNRHIESIVDGAKARLFMAQGKPYTDTTLAMEARQRFEDRLLTAYWARTRNRTRGRGRVKGHFY